MERRSQRYLLTGAAALGAGVLIGVGAITATGGADPMTASEPPTGETSTWTTPPSTPTITKASPNVTASTSQGEWPETSTAKPAE